MTDTPVDLVATREAEYQQALERCLRTSRFVRRWTFWSFLVTIGAAACSYFFAQHSAIRAVVFGFAGALLTNVPVLLWRDRQRAARRRDGPESR